MTAARPRSVYLVGAPGVGKSTLMTRLLAAWFVLPDEPLNGLLRGHPLVSRSDGETPGVYLGRQRRSYPGTDALSMGVSPDAVTWAAFHPLPAVVLGEGARLGTGKFLGTLAARTDLLLVHLRADPEALAARRAGRGSDQNEAWTRGVRTAARRAADQAAAWPGVRVLDLDTTSLTPGEVFDAVEAGQ